jgi:hypothetical protein
MKHNIIKFSLVLGFILLSSMSFGQEQSVEVKETDNSQSSTILGMSVTGNRESPRSLTIVPWRDPLMNGKSPEIVPVWQPNLKLLDPDAYRRDVKLFLKFRTQRLTLQNANQ